jgi:3-dehydroquinate dehydratase-2
MECDVLLLNGPNLNMLGVREPEIYGQHTLEAIELQCQARATAHELRLEAFQSNHEGDLIDKLNEAFGAIKGLIINPSGYTHTSIALRDAVSMLRIPTIEVHLSNIHARESFRQVSFISGVATAIICGLGPVGYIHAVDAVANIIKSGSSKQP